MKRETFLGTMQFACPVQRLKDSFRQDLSKSAGLKHVREGFRPRDRPQSLNHVDGTPTFVLREKRTNYVLPIGLQR